MSQKFTASAPANIALIKYWGKRDAKLFLPYNSSFSVTLGGLKTITTVQFLAELSQDELSLNGSVLSSKEKQYVKIERFLNLIRRRAKSKLKARVVSENNFPTGAGLASSASGFAALALAGSRAAGLKMSSRRLSILARQGSGSAARSIYGGFVEWRRGVRGDGLDSYSRQVFNESYWPEFRIIAVTVSKLVKAVSSSEGMANTIKTSPFYKFWPKRAARDLKVILKAVREKKFSLLGEIAETNALTMHALMLTARPPLLYFLPATISIINKIHELREKGMSVYFTIDAGPQVKIICLEKNVKVIRAEMLRIHGVEEARVCQIGGGAKLISRHLF